jgi:phenylacetate-CoA ligase
MVYSLRELHDTYKIAGKFIGEYMLKDYLAGDEPKWVATTLADFQLVE